MCYRVIGILVHIAFKPITLRTKHPATPREIFSVGSTKRAVSNYSCSVCDELYWFSSCWNEVAQDSCSWHCNDCKQCRVRLVRVAL